MRTIALQDGADFDGWRMAARQLLQDQVPPEQVTWLVSGEASLLPEASDNSSATSPAAQPAARIPAAFLGLMQALICHSDPQRYGLAYRLLWRLLHGERQLLQLLTDPDVLRARNAEKNVRRDSHKMKAFVRFREVQAEPGSKPMGAAMDQTIYAAWFEPSHYIVERIAPFFVRRFTGMRWSILTPYRSAHWDGRTLHFGPGATKADAPSEDVLEDYWRTYFANIFNPARLKEQAMLSEMPVKYWKNLPEAQLIPTLIREARPRTLAMVEAEATAPKKRFAAPALPLLQALPQGSLAELRAQAKGCRACPLWEPATQMVFGEGPADARLMLVGEQPDDHEDLAGRPFIGPAGKLLDRALAEAGLHRQALYLTHCVKHFKFSSKNIFRQAVSTTADEQRACQPWLRAEIQRVQPRLIVCLGAMAAHHLISPHFDASAQREPWHQWPDGTRLMTTRHPTELLLMKQPAIRDRAYLQFVNDLREVAMALARLSETLTP